VQCSRIDAQDVHHVGFHPDPWDWADWVYAKKGRFDGRWDDPAGEWRALYVGSCALASYLEVLAPLRPDPDMERAMAEIVSDSDDDEEHPTTRPGELTYRWRDERRLCSAKMSGCFALPGHYETLPTLRQQFLTLARSFGLMDVDGAAIRESGPRDLTQAISAWIYDLTGPAGEQASGIQYLSRHGDEFTLWAIYERGEDHPSPPEITNHTTPQPVTAGDPALVEAMRIHRIVWED
jgi:hypothetical protein